MFNIFSKIKDWLGQALRDRLALSQDQLSISEKKRQTLEKENIKLLHENRELRITLESMQKERTYIDLGVCCLTKNQANMTVPLCPIYKKPLSKHGVRYECTPCSYKTEASVTHGAIRRYYDHLKNRRSANTDQAVS